MFHMFSGYAMRRWNRSRLTVAARANIRCCDVTISWTRRNQNPPLCASIRIHSTSTVINTATAVGHSIPSLLYYHYNVAQPESCVPIRVDCDIMFFSQWEVDDNYLHVNRICVVKLCAHHLCSDHYDTLYLPVLPVIYIYIY